MVVYGAPEISAADIHPNIFPCVQQNTVIYTDVEQLDIE